MPASAWVAIVCPVYGGDDFSLLLLNVVCLHDRGIGTLRLRGPTKQSKWGPSELFNELWPG